MGTGFGKLFETGSFLLMVDEDDDDVLDAAYLPWWSGIGRGVHSLPAEEVNTMVHLEWEMM